MKKIFTKMKHLQRISKSIAILSISLTMTVLTVNGQEPKNINGEIIWPLAQKDFNLAPREGVSPNSLRLWDSYNCGGPTSYGSLLEICGRPGHMVSQLYFGGWDNSRIRYREAFYSQNQWNAWRYLLDSKNDIESSGSLKITGSGNHFIQNGNVAIGTTNPGDATLKIYKSQWPQFALADDNTQFQINIARNAWDWTPGSKPGDVVFRNLGLSHNLIFCLTNDNSDGNSYVAYADYGTGNIWMKIANNRTVRIDGKVFATEMNIQPNVWADDVFDNGYKLMNLKELELFVQANKHLPGVPSEKEVKENGVNVSEMNAVLLRKVEELSLHIIELNKKIEALEKRK